MSNGDFLNSTTCKNTPYAYIEYMFFLRPDYKYGDPAERPELLDEALAAELRTFLHAIPSSITENQDGDCNIFEIYKGPHSLLFILAVTHAVRAMSNGDPRAVTKDMLLVAARDQKNWPTRGYLMPRISGKGYYEVNGPDDVNYQIDR